MTEAEAIRLAQLGDAGRLNASTGFHSGEIYAFCCLRMVGNPAEAEDLTRMLSCNCSARSRHSWRIRISTWLHRLAVNVVLMKLRKKNPAARLRWRKRLP